MKQYDHRIPAQTWEAILEMLKEGQKNNYPLESIIMRISILAYTAGMNSGLKTALWLCEETAQKIHTTN